MKTEKVGLTHAMEGAIIDLAVDACKGLSSSGRHTAGELLGSSAASSTFLMASCMPCVL